MAVRGLLARAGSGVAGTAPVMALRRWRLGPSAQYWEKRYAAGGTSGAGSYGAAAEWKAGVVNRWLKENEITSVVDLGCGDGNQLAALDCPRYLGLDVSRTAVRLCAERFESDPSKSFLRYDPEALFDRAGWLRADAAMSLEVIFHLVESEVYETYMRHLFAVADRYVIICNNSESGGRVAPHLRFRSFTDWVAENCGEWQQIAREDPPQDLGLVSSFYLYRREGTA